MTDKAEEIDETDLDTFEAEEPEIDEDEAEEITAADEMNPRPKLRRKKASS